MLLESVKEEATPKGLDTVFKAEQSTLQKLKTIRDVIIIYFSHFSIFSLNFLIEIVIIIIFFVVERRLGKEKELKCKV